MLAGSPLTVGDQAIAGVGAGLAAAAIACPTELIKCRLQAQAGTRPSAVGHVPLSMAVALPGTTPGAIQVLNFEVSVVIMSWHLAEINTCMK